MAISYNGGKIKTDGLIFAYDMGNRKSMIGPPMTNVFGTTIAQYHNENKPFAATAHGSSAISTDVKPPHVGDTVYKITDNGVDTQNVRYSLRIDCDIADMSYDEDYVWSFYIYLPSEFSGRYTGWSYGIAQNSTGTDWHFTRGYNATYDFYGAGSIHSASSGIDFTKLDQWQRVWVKFKPLTANIQLPENSGLDNNKWAAGYMRVNVSGAVSGGTPYYLYVASGQLEQNPYVTTYDQIARTGIDGDCIADISPKRLQINSSNLSTYNSETDFEFVNTNSDYITVNSSTSKSELRLDAVTISYWFYTNWGTSNWSPFIGMYATTTENYRTWIGADKIIDFVGSSQVALYNASSDIANNQWYNIVVTADYNDVRCYINGELKATNTTVTIGPQGLFFSSFLYIGKDRADNFGSGKLPIVNIYDNVLSADEIKQNFESQRVRFNV